MAKIADVQEVSLEKLRPYERNAKKHGAGQIEKLKASIMEFGFLTPCLIDSNYNIIAGHGRVMAAKDLGLESVPCVFIEGLSDEQRRAYILADNRLGELGEWNFDLVFDELAELDELGFDIELTGFEMPEEIPEVIEDDFDEDSVPDEPRCKLGDLWQLGEHRLICGDSTDVNVIERLMDGQKADMVFTDPPYGMSLNTEYDEMFANDKQHKKTGARFDKVIGDNDDFDEDFINTIFSNFGYCKEIFIWGADYFSELIPERKNGSWVCWDKRTTNEMDKVAGNTFELCFSKQRHKRLMARILWSGWHGMGEKSEQKRLHPTQKPLKLVKFFFDNWGDGIKTVVDLFGGSGSTLIACEQLNRKCFMCELDPHYCDVIINRWETLTGREAVLIDG